MLNFILILAVLFITAAVILNVLKKKQTAEVEGKVEVDEKTYNIDKMTAFIKRRLDEITKVNLYDIGLSEAELERRKNKKYELKKALKGCTYGDVNDKKYVKTLIYDLLLQEYGVNEINISKAIPFDLPSLLTPQDKFDILLYTYQKEFGYEALTQIIKKYDLASLKYVQGEAKPSYVITSEEIEEIYRINNPQDSIGEYYTFNGARGKISIINPLRDYSCSRCNIVEITSSGTVKLCSLSEEEKDIRFYLDKPMIFREILKEIIMEKPERFYLNY